MPSIRNLTKHQVAMLDHMWACDSLEEYEDFLETLDSEDRNQAEQLQRLLLIECLDEDMVAQTEYPEAKALLDRIAES